MREAERGGEERSDVGVSRLQHAVMDNKNKD
jgi:hypothetical protein